MGTIALTGGTGFVGNHVVNVLTRHNSSLRLLARNPARSASLPRNVEVVHGSLEDDEALEELVATSDTVVHCAGSVRGATPEQFDQVNVEGTARLVRIARANGCRRFLLLSSLAAREPQLSPYASSKHGGEEALKNGAGNMIWAALRPPAVYGPGDTEMLPLFHLMARGIAPVFGPADARFSLIFAPDLAEAIAAWAECGDPPSGVFEIDDGKPGGYGWEEITNTIRAITGKPVRRIRVPAAVLRVPAAINWLLGRYFGRAPMLTPGKIRELRHPDWVCRRAPEFDALGWQPEHSLAQGLVATPGWRCDGHT